MGPLTVAPTPIKDARRTNSGDLPRWLEVHQTSGPEVVADLGAGEMAATTLAIELHADPLPMDERHEAIFRARLILEREPLFLRPAFP
jgi:predicted nucleic acid-binding protein